MKRRIIKKNLPIIHHLRARPTLFLSVLAGVILFFFQPATWHWQLATRMLVAWDTSLLFYLLIVGWVMFRGTTESIRRRAALQDEGRNIFLLLTTGAAVASLVAIIAELAIAKELNGGDRLLHVLLAATTVVLSWIFMQTMFALHYAHDYYMAMDREAIHGLEFPGHPRTPDYWDFIYFSFVIGAAAQTADVKVTSHLMRRTVTLHCVIVFFFNTAIIALTINIAAGLF
ncbi:MAG: DUF1345 domain-containing protein [Hydrotalea sp.]|nr:DUF1345 domain-containing protein [Hydrotalea sp.]